MICGQCGNEPPDDSRYCNMCGHSLTGETAQASEQGLLQRRWIFIELLDLKIPAHMQTIDDRSEVVSYLYERFTPFADEGWEWELHPSDFQFDGWVYQDDQDGRLMLAGAKLLCRRVVTADLLRAVDPQHHVPQHRTRQLIQRLWSADSGTPPKRPTGTKGSEPAGSSGEGSPS